MIPHDEGRFCPTNEKVEIIVKKTALRCRAAKISFFKGSLTQHGFSGLDRCGFSRLLVSIWFSRGFGRCLLRIGHLVL
jgi:hypothetical protein